MTFNSAYLLVFHGSRDPRSQIGMKRLTKLVSESIKAFVSIPEATSRKTLLLSKPLLLEAACLELGLISLSEKIYELGLTGKQQGLSKIKIMPLFLSTGVHVQKDIPKEIEVAQAKLGEKIEIKLCSHLGSCPGIVELINQQYQELPSEGRILLSHGSSLKAANKEIETLANNLGAKAAYTSVSPNLSEQVERLIKAGKQAITIVPYVLLPGKITDAIADQIKHLQQEFPNVNFYVGKPIGMIPALPQTIATAITA